MSDVDTRQLGLEVLQVVARHFVKAEDLHFGVWPDDLEVCWGNLTAAQANHSELIRRHIPDGARTILDVGGGAGYFARKLRDHGYDVDLVSPSEHLGREAAARLGPESHIYLSRFEDLVTDKRYDVVLFSESFQYVDIERGLELAATLLEPGSHLLICDYFRRDVPGKPPVGGGHRWSVFAEALAKAPFERTAHVDITEETSRNFGLIDEFIGDVASPVRDLVASYAAERHPFVTRVLRWKFRRRLDKLDRRYFSRRINPESFRHHLDYRLDLYRRT